MEDQRQIQLAAAKLFMTVGIKSVSMDDIARQVGISKKTIYKHFPSKDALVDRVMRSHIEMEKEACMSLMADGINPIQQMIDISHYISAAHKDMNNTIIFDLQKYYRKHWQMVEEFRMGFVAEGIQHNLEIGRKEGWYRDLIDDKLVAHLYITLIEGILKIFTEPTNKHDFKTLHLQMVRYHLYGICTPKGLTYLEEHINEI